MSRSRCAMSNNQRNGISTFWVSSDGMMECGRESPPSSAREIPRLRCFRCAMVIQNLQRAAAVSACCISLFVQTGKIFSRHSKSLKSAASNSNSRTTRFRTPFIFAILMGIRSRSQPTNCNERRNSLRPIKGFIRDGNDSERFGFMHGN